MAMGWRSQLYTGLKDGMKPVVDLVYPPRCPLCGDPLAMQGGLCLTCWSSLEIPGEPSCASCQRPLADTAASYTGQCGHCMKEAPDHAGIIAATLYNDASRKLILSFKHGGKIALAPLLARLIAARMEPADEAPLLVPVPLHRWRIWKRGFNQAALLARELEKLSKGNLCVDALVRNKRTPSLGGLGPDERRGALEGAIAVRKRAQSQIRDRDVVLVDDVLTSGATSEACVKALARAGARSIRIACFARVIDGHGMVSARAGLKSETPEAMKAPGAT